MYYTTFASVVVLVLHCVPWLYFYSNDIKQSHEISDITKSGGISFPTQTRNANKQSRTCQGIGPRDNFLFFFYIFTDTYLIPPQKVINFK